MIKPTQGETRAEPVIKVYEAVLRQIADCVVNGLKTFGVIVIPIKSVEFGNN